MLQMINVEPLNIPKKNQFQTSAEFYKGGHEQSEISKKEVQLPKVKLNNLNANMSADDMGYDENYDEVEDPSQPKM